MTPSWLAALQRLLPKEEGQHAFRALAIGRALANPRNVTFMIFADRESEPRWILRCHRDESTAAREAQVLGEMQRRGLRLQPELSGCGRCEDMHAELLRFCKGDHGTLDLWRRQDVVAQLASELAEMQLALAPWAHSTLDGHAPPIAELCGAIQQAGGAVGRETDLIRTLEESREWLTRARAPSLPQHGDCGRSNLLWEAGAIRLLDWEHFGCVFEPFLDVWTFALSLCEDSGDAQAQSLFAEGANATASDVAIRRYASRVGVPADVGRQVFPLALARFIHLNVTLGRKDVARRASRTLDAYLANASSFMRALQRP